MSHGDLVTKLPPGAKAMAKSKTGHMAAMEIKSKTGHDVWALQFHPEVTHTDDGLKILKEFVFKKCKASRTWSGKKLLQHLSDEVKKRVGDTDHVLVGLSGGVDSTVTAVLLTKILGRERVH